MSTLSKHSPVNSDSKPYWDATHERRLVFKKCAHCGYVQYPPRHLCPKCWNDKAQWITHNGAGTVYSFSIVRRAPNAVYAEKVPYVIAMIDLEGGPRMLANLIGDDALQVKISDS